MPVSEHTAALQEVEAERAELVATNQGGFDEVLKLRNELEAMTDARDLCKRQTAQANERLDKTTEAWKHEKDRADAAQGELDRERRRTGVGSRRKGALVTAEARVLSAEGEAEKWRITSDAHCSVLLRAHEVLLDRFDGLNADDKCEEIQRLLTEFDSWLSFRGEFAEVRTAFRSAFGTDTSAAALSPDTEQGPERCETGDRCACGHLHEHHSPAGCRCIDPRSKEPCGCDQFRPATSLPEPSQDSGGGEK
jgi:hypothetical protein